ncbi:hypothetical protein GCM10011574_17390 [Microbispora bryophytorum]|uniref:Uncharacterized protein n=1 Tax=Microbispora bryophytorum TaxID=1460882 RepID=A0A8H9LF88_9ACTN|nr:hypothetical protein GCM10011574_17390 [Microbispora bryophytorum]
MNLKARNLWGALATAGLAVVVNLATEWKHNLLAWVAVPVLATLAVLLEPTIDKGRRHRATSHHRQPLLLVLHWEERNGNARRTVSTTSEKVATEFLRRVPPPLETPLDSTKPQLKHL